MATIGPLTHMQAERRAFWILRTVPVPLGQPARGQGARLGGDRRRQRRRWCSRCCRCGCRTYRCGAAGDGIAGVVGAAIMSFVAVAMASRGRGSRRRPVTAVGPATIYAFMLVGGLFNLVLVEDTPVRGAGLALYAFAGWTYWRAGIEHGLLLHGRRGGADAARARVGRRHDADRLCARGAGAGARRRERSAWPAARLRARLRLALLAIVGALVVIYLARRPRAAGRLPPVASAGVGLGAGALAGVVMAWLGGGAWLIRSGGHAAVAVIVALGMLAEELLYRGVIQDGIEQEVAYRPGRILGGAARCRGRQHGARGNRRRAVGASLAGVHVAADVGDGRRRPRCGGAHARGDGADACGVPGPRGCVCRRHFRGAQCLAYDNPDASFAVLARAGCIGRVLHCWSCACGVDESGLSQKPFLPHDAAAD